MRFNNLIVIAFMTILTLAGCGPKYVNIQHPEFGTKESEIALDVCKGEVGGLQAFSNCRSIERGMVSCSCDYSCNERYWNAVNACMNNKGWIEKSKITSKYNSKDIFYNPIKLHGKVFILTKTDINPNEDAEAILIGLEKCHKVSKSGDTLIVFIRHKQGDGIILKTLYDDFDNLKKGKISKESWGYGLYQEHLTAQEIEEAYLKFRDKLKDDS